MKREAECPILVEGRGWSIIIAQNQLRFVSGQPPLDELEKAISCYKKANQKKSM